MNVKILLFVFLFFVNKSLSGKIKVDSLINNCINSNVSDTNIAKCIDLKSFEISSIDPRAGIILAQRVLKISIKEKWEKGIALANNELAVCYNILGKFDSAILHYKQALKVFSQLRNAKAQSSVLTNISQVYRAKGDYLFALKLLDKAYKIQVKSNMAQAQGITLENIGATYLELSDFTKAKKFFHLARYIYLQQRDSQSIIRNTINLGIVYGRTAHYDSALNYLNAALSYSLKKKGSTTLQNVYANLGLIYMHLKDYKNAIYSHSKSIELCLELKSENSLAIEYGNLGEVYLEKFRMDSDSKDLDQAIRYLKKGYFLCQTIGFTPPQIEFGEKLIESLELHGKDYKLAYFVISQVTQLKDSIYSKDNRIKINEIESKNEIEQKEKELKISKIENRLTKTENKKHKQHKIILVLVIIIFGLFILLLYLIYLNRDRLFKRRMTEISQFQSHQVRTPVVKILALSEALRNKDTEQSEVPILLDMLEKSTKELDERIHEIVDKMTDKQS